MRACKTLSSRSESLVPGQRHHFCRSCYFFSECVKEQTQEHDLLGSSHRNSVRPSPIIQLTVDVFRFWTREQMSLGLS